MDTPQETTPDTTLDTPGPAYYFFTESRGQDLEREVDSRGDMHYAVAMVRRAAK